MSHTVCFGYFWLSYVCLMLCPLSRMTLQMRQESAGLHLIVTLVFLCIWLVFMNIIVCIVPLGLNVCNVAFF